MDTTSINHDNHRVRLRGGVRGPVVVLASLAVLSSAACGGGSGEATDYPDQEITFVVPFAAGGPTDTVTRLISKPMAEELGQQIVVQNVEGAGGTVAAGEVATAEPDGYTVLVHHIGMSTAPALYPDLPYDPMEDFKTIGLITDVPMTIVARRDFEPDTLEDLVAYLQAERRHRDPRQRGHRRRLPPVRPAARGGRRRDLTEVPYDGTGPAMTDLVGGQVDFMCDQTTNTAGQITVRRDQGVRGHDTRARSRRCRTSRPRQRRACPTSRWASGMASTCRSTPRTTSSRS